MRNNGAVILGLIILFIFVGPYGHTGAPSSSKTASLDLQYWARLISSNTGIEGAYRGFPMAQIRPTDDGNYVVGGYQWSDSAGGYSEHMNILKIGSSGNVIWAISAFYSGEGGWSRVKSLVGLPDGRIVVLGEYMDSYWSIPNCYLVLMMLDQNGSVLWIKTFLSQTDQDSPTPSTAAYDLQAAGDGNLILVGHLDQGPWMAKIDTSGNFIWQHRLEAIVLSIQETADGGFIGAGISGGYRSTATAVAWLAKFNAQGEIVWQKSYGHPPGAKGFCRILAVKDGYVCLGEKQALSRNDVWIVKLNLQGNIRWQKAYGRANPAYRNSAASIVPLLNGGYLVGAHSDLYKIGNAGTLAWAKRYSADIADAIEADQDDILLLGEPNLPANCDPVGSTLFPLFFMAKINQNGKIGINCCIPAVGRIIGRQTAVASHNTHYSLLPISVQVDTILPTDPGFKTADVYTVCQAGVQ